MLVASKDGRRIRAMMLNESVDQCRGVVQCALPGCEAYMAIVEPGARRASGDIEDQSPSAQVSWFLDHHECRTTGRTHTGRPHARRRHR